MRFVHLDDTDEEQTMTVPVLSFRNHQIQVDASDLATLSIEVYGRMRGSDRFVLLGEVDLTEKPAVKIFEGVYQELKFVPSAAQTYSIDYVGWR